MQKNTITLIYTSIFLTLTSCQSSSTSKNVLISPNLLTDYKAVNDDGLLNALIEIPSGTIDKWELNKLNGQIEWESIDGNLRTINYLGYPGNYGLIPQTLLSKEKGGDGDPLDILVIGPPAERGSIVKCKLLGVLFLTDQGKQDDKLIAVSQNSFLYKIDDMNDLDKNYSGISKIIKLWFTNYKGPNKTESKGFEGKNFAKTILDDAIHEFKLNEIKSQ